MKQTVTERFNMFKNDSIGAVITLNRAVKGQNFTVGQVTRAFNNLVPKDEYAKNEKTAILKDTLSKLASA